MQLIALLKSFSYRVPHFATTENESVPNKDLRCLYFLCQFFIFSHSFKFLSVFIFYVPTYYLRAYAFLICLHIFYVLSFFTWLYIFLRVFIFLSVLSSLRTLHALRCFIFPSQIRNKEGKGVIDWLLIFPDPHKGNQDLSRAFKLKNLFFKY